MQQLEPPASRRDEDDLTQWLRRRASRRALSHIGDDAAILPLSDATAITMDSQIAGVHFSPDLDPAIVARRLLSVNLSDLAAMGALPSYAFLALCAPSGFDHRRFLEAFVRCCEKLSLTLAGGDLTRHTTLTATLTLLGKKPPGQRWLRRGAARAGERLWLGDSVGESAAGLCLLERGAALKGRGIHLPPELAAPARLEAAARRAVRRHLSPRPQLDLGQWLGSCSTGAAIDVSDGLARDLHRLCAESEVGAEVDIERLPLSSLFRQLADALERHWLDLALAGGEDYALLFTLPAGTEPPDRFGCRKIGRVLARRGIYSTRGGKRRPLPPLGWDHLAGTASRQ